MSSFTKIGLFLATAIAIVYGIVLSATFGVTPSIAPRKTPAPDGFDAAQYQTLIDLQSTDQMHVGNLNGLGDPFHPGFLTDPAIVYVTVSTGPYDSFYVFFNKQGREIGRRERTRTMSPLGSLFMDIDGYFAVTQQGVGDQQSYIDVENGALIPFATLEKLHAKSTTFRTISYHDAPRESETYKQKINTYILKVDGVWLRAKMAQSDPPQFLDWKTPSFPQFHTQYRFPTKDDPNQDRTTYNSSSFYDGKYTIYQTWFDEQEYFRRRAASIGSTTGQGRAEHWRGTGYYEIAADDKSIKFAIPNDRKILSGSGRFTMKVMGHESLDLMVIERYAGNDAQYYIVSTKD